MDGSYTIGPARPEDLPKLAAIELEAASLFAGWEVADGILSDSTAPAEFQAGFEAGLLWLARDAGGEPVGFALVELLEGGPHLEEIDVHPDHGRRGVGRALVETVCSWARREGHGSLTLTTFRDIPWNAPFYAGAGFRIVEAHELPSELRELVAEETERGLDSSRRVVMRRDLGAAVAELP